MLIQIIGIQLEHGRQDQERLSQLDSHKNLLFWILQSALGECLQRSANRQSLKQIKVNVLNNMDYIYRIIFQTVIRMQRIFVISEYAVVYVPPWMKFTRCLQQNRH